MLFFPSAFQHMALYTDPTPHNDGLIDIRFAFSRSALDDASYPPTRDGRAPFVPLGVNSCPVLGLAPGAGNTNPRFDWCYDNVGDYAATSIDASTKYMASGVVLSADGATLSLYSGGEPITHGGGGGPGAEGTMMGAHTGIRRHIMRRDGFVGLSAGYGGAHLPVSHWPQMLTVPLSVPNASACASGDIELRANLLSGVGGGA